MAEPQQQAQPQKKPPAPKYLIVINNEERARTIPLRSAPDPVSKTLPPGPVFHLVPGANIVERALWERFKSEHKDRESDEGPIQGWASILLRTEIPRDAHKNRRAERAGQPYLVEGPAVRSKENPFLDLTEDEIRRVLPEFTVLPELRGFLALEKRPNVAAMIQGEIKNHDRADAEAKAS